MKMQMKMGWSEPKPGITLVPHPEFYDKNYTRHNTNWEDLNVEELVNFFNNKINQSPGARILMRSSYQKRILESRHDRTLQAARIHK